MFKEQGLDAVILNTLIDTHFISFMESNNREVKFRRVDADITGSMKSEDSNEEDNKKLAEKLEKIFRESTNKEKLKIKVEALKNESTPAIVLISEEARRFKDMSRTFGTNFNTADLFPDEETLVLNSNNNIIKRIAALLEEDNRKEDVKLAAAHVYDLAAMSQRTLEPESMTKFFARSNELLMRLL